MSLPSAPAKPFEVAIPQADLDDMLSRLIADLWHTLMTDVLGYRRFCAGGD
jgi:hypothetical protein